MITIDVFSPTDCFGSNAYLIGCNNEYAIVDPSVSYEYVLSLHPEIASKMKYVLLTHCHFDHILEINSWAEQGIEVVVCNEDASALSDPYLNCYLGFLGIEKGYHGKYSTVKDNDILNLGNDSIRVIHTPGHTPGCVCYRIQDNIFVGDTVFENGGYGRCDLPGGDIDVLEKSLIKLLTRETDAKVYPGHGGNTSIKEIVTYFM